MSNQINACIWMEAGVIEYQLCPLNYNCDACDIHKNLTQRIRPEEETDLARGLVYVNIPDQDLACFRPGFNFLDGNIWVRRQTNTQVRLGLNPFLWQIFPTLEKILLPIENRHVEKLDCIAWLIFRNGMIGVRSPFEGTLVARNHDLDGNILNPLSFRYSDGFDIWLVELDMEANRFAEIDWYSREHLETDLRHHWSILKEFSEDSEMNLSLGSNRQTQKPNWQKLILNKPTYSNLLKNLTDGTLFVC